MNRTKKHLVTSALPYANGPLHIGQIAGAYLPADIYVRYLKLKGEDVVFVCGSDEHGAAITLRAKKEETTPQAIVDKYHQINKKAFQDFGIDFDIFHRTSSQLHHETASDYFKKLYDEGHFEVNTSKQYFDEEHQQFLADRYITGTCPKCDKEGAYGDQCEKCGSALSPTELVNPVSTLSGKTPVLKETKHWYLPMNKFEGWLKEWIVDGHKEWKPNVYGQCKSWLDAGLKSRAMTRDLDWGVKVPLQDAEGKVLYVWLDAPIGYISATKQWAKDNGKNWRDYWQSEDAELIHFIGKDNIVFHCIIFPILLKAHGDYILPTNVPANEFLNLEGDKLSTSRNNAVWLHEYLEDFPNRKDELRYVLNAVSPETKDSDFSWKDYQARVNNELVAILGNFVNRAVVLTHKFFDGKVPYSNHVENELLVVKDFENRINNFNRCIQNFRFREAINEAMSVARLGNKYLADTEPWKKIKTDEELAKAILNVALQIAAEISILIKPFLPNTACKIESMLQLPALGWSDLGKFNHVKTGVQMSQPELLFQKVDDGEIDNQIKKLALAKQQNLQTKKHQPVKEEITFDDFTKLDIRIGKILTAEKVEKADKLLKLNIDTGIDQRTVVSGIAEHYKAEEIVGKKVSVLLNLAPRKIRGVESQGMILMAENEEGKLAFVEPSEDFEAGAGVS